MESINYLQVTGPLSCVRCNYSTRQEHERNWSYTGQLALFNEHLNTMHPDWQTETTDSNSLKAQPDPAEHQRLKDAVVETLKEFRKTSDDFQPSGAYGQRANPWYNMIAAVDALITFESKEEG